MSSLSFEELIADKKSKNEAPVFNIPAGVSFVDEFAQVLLDWVGDDFLSLSEYLILLPSRRACRSLREAFLRITDGRPLILPRMQPVGDVDDEGLDMLLSATLEEIPNASDNILDIPPAITPLHRQILLARTIMAAGQISQLSASYEQALSIAAELGNFLDEVQTENLSFDGLKDLVTQKEFAEHWQLTLDFLSILTEHWPKILEAQGVIDPAERRNRLLKMQTELWQQHPPQYKVIVAGVTGSIPAVRDLLVAIAGLPNSMIVTAGLDMYLSEKDWKHVEHEHPQYYLKLLLEHLNVERREVSIWNNQAVNTPVSKLIAESMRPAITSGVWQTLSSDNIDEKSLSGIRRVDCKTSQEEASVIALAMREALETPEKTAVLVTPDRKLSQRVQACLQRWGVVCDDSGGSLLTDMPAGQWLLLTAEMIQKKSSPVSMLSCLRHPFAAAGLEAGVLEVWTDKVDKNILRGREILKYNNFSDLKSYIEDEDRVYDSIYLCMIGIEELSEQPPQSLKTWLTEHIKYAEALACRPDKTGAYTMWRNEDGEVAARFIHDLQSLSDDVPELNIFEYMALLQNLLKTVTVRPKYAQHPRLNILGQIEARLYTADLVIIGGLNEGTWPHDSGHDPWMSRPMRREYNLPPVECRIGIEAHDFSQLASAKEVLMTRAKNVEGTPSVPARWLLRMDTVLQAVGLEWRSRKDLLKWVGDIDTPKLISPCECPAPCPPVSARPRTLSATRIETWMRDPYGIYASYILKLKALEDLERDAGASERGQIMHTILERFVHDYCLNGVPNNALEILLSYGREEFEKMELPAELYIFWWPRFERMASELIKHEISWQEQAKPSLVEASGKHEFNTSYGTFTLMARADRIDVMRDGAGAAIIDYKTGAPPSKRDVIDGFSPQLPLEALLVANNAFHGVDTDKTAELLFWQISGGYPPLKEVKLSAEEVEAAIKNTEQGLLDLIAVFDNPDTPYYAVPYLDKAPTYNDYAHLERILEWGYIN